MIAVSFQALFLFAFLYALVFWGVLGGVGKKPNMHNIVDNEISSYGFFFFYV